VRAVLLANCFPRIAAMHLLFRLYAAPAHGCHPKLALDALQRLACVDADRWQKLFLAHADLYLAGATAPDEEFKDFNNHVLYPRDDYWGGAAQKAVSWYQHLLEALAGTDWPTAVYCAGVLSHYYTDPLHPFQTAQSEAKNNIHRAVEWSIYQSYDRLRTQGEREFPAMPAAVGQDGNWLATLVCAGAERANAVYEKLIAHYDLQRGVVDPPTGLDPIARRIIAELISYAAASYAVVLARAIAEAQVRPPEVPLAAVLLRAACRLPAKLMARRLADARRRREIEASYDELIATGKVENTLGEAERSVRDLYAQEVLAKRKPARPVSQIFAFQPRPRVLTRIDQTRAARIAAARAPDNVVAFEAVPRRPPALAASQPGAGRPERARAGPTLSLAEVEPKADGARRQRSAAAAARPNLSLEQDVRLSPSIGAKTAKRLNAHGVRTVRELIRADPTALAVLMAQRQISAEMISGWQDQARLVCTIPGLTGTHAQLLVGAGYASAEAIAGAELEHLCADVLGFALAAAGQRLLRAAAPPDAAEIRGWLEAARSVRAA
jgi:predicted flap endonuclease-1-like 5' DNA nuclease